jgi:hypothetical protein
MAERSEPSSNSGYSNNGEPRSNYNRKEADQSDSRRKEQGAGESQTSQNYYKVYDVYNEHTASSNGYEEEPLIQKSSWINIEGIATFRKHMAEVQGRVTGEHLKRLLESSLRVVDKYPEASLDESFSNRVETYLMFNPVAASEGYKGVAMLATMQHLEDTLDKIKDPEQLQKVLALLNDKGLVSTEDALKYLEKRTETPENAVSLAVGFINQLEKSEYPPRSGWLAGLCSLKGSN